MLVYLVSRSLRGPWLEHLYRGDIYYMGLVEGDVPLTRNSPDKRPVTYKAHSGRIVPEAWVDFWIHVSPRLREVISSRIPAVEFREVHFEKLVDVDLDYPEPDHWEGSPLEGLRHCREFEDRFRGYATILRQHEDRYRSGPPVRDWKTYSPGWGTDASSFSSPHLVAVSESLLEEYPLLWAGHFQVREDLFAILAPHLDPYFTAFSFVDTERDPVLEPPKEDEP